MNKHVKLIKKGLMNMCNRLKNSHTNTVVQQQVVESSNECKSVSSGISVDLEKKCSGYISSTETGYASSASSTISSSVCDDLVFNKQSIIKNLLDYQIDYLNSLNYGLENFVRPLSVIINEKLYFQLFQNIEKLYVVTQFLRNTISESIKFTSDVYISTISVLSEYISIIRDTYEIYLNGYTQAGMLIDNEQVQGFIKELNAKYGSDFDLNKFINLPIKNFNKIVSTFKLLKKFKNDVDVSDDENLLKLFKNFKDLYLVKKQKMTSVKNSMCFDYVDSNGNKYYFI